MKVKEIKDALKPLGILRGINLYRDEPTPLFHCVSIERGKAEIAIKAIKEAGGKAWHSHSFGPYTEGISVER